MSKFVKFKGPEPKYAVQHSQFLQFNSFGTFVTNDPVLIAELDNNPRCERIAEYDNEEDIVLDDADVDASEKQKSPAPAKADNPASDVMKTLRAEYNTKFKKKADGNWSEEQLREELAKEVPAAEPKNTTPAKADKNK